MRGDNITGLASRSAGFVFCNSTRNVSNVSELAGLIRANDVGYDRESLREIFRLLGVDVSGVPLDAGVAPRTQR